MGCASSAPAPRKATPEEIEAERHEGKIMELAQHYEKELQAVLAELNSAKEAYRKELADETNRRLSRQTTPANRRSVNAKKERVDDLEQEHKNLHAEWKDEMAFLRKKQRVAALAAEAGSPAMTDGSTSLQLSARGRV